MPTVLYAAAASKIGGGNKVLIELIRNLDRSRFQPVIVAPEDGPLVDWARTAGVPCLMSSPGDWQGRRRLASRSWELARLIRQTRARIVHAASPMSYRALGLAATLTGAARVCHLGFPPEAGELKRSFLAGPDVVIGCYEGQANEHRDEIRRIRPGCRTIGIPNAVDTTLFAPGEPSAGIAGVRENASSVIAILGHVSAVKGYTDFVDAAATVAKVRPDCLFLAIGGETAQPGAMASVAARAQQLGISDRLRFLGFRHDVHEILKAVDIVALPSHAEGFPLAVLEAMSAGKAVVATPVGGVPEAIVDGDTGLLVPPKNAPALAAAFVRLIDSPRLRQTLAASARARIEERYSISRFASRIQEVYGSLLKGSPAALSPRTARCTSS